MHVYIKLYAIYAPASLKYHNHILTEQSFTLMKIKFYDFLTPNSLLSKIPIQNPIVIIIAPII